MSTRSLLSTDRLILRPPVTFDIPALIDACQDPLVQRVISHTGEYTEADAEHYLANAQHGWQEATRYTWAIIPPENVFAGQISLTRTNDNEATIGYWLAPEFRGQGILPEAAAAVIDHALNPAGMNLASIRWNAYAGNLASAHVAQKLGFHFAGIAETGSLGWNLQQEAWVAYLRRDDKRTPQPWPVLEHIPA